MLTNVLDLTRLTVAEALVVYPRRWTIERLFFDLKEALNLHGVYAANPNAVAMQVYAAGCGCNVLRVAQTEVAEAAGVAPKAISPAKVFSKMAAACYRGAAFFALWFGEAQHANRGRRLRKPPVQQRRFARVPLDAILVEPRKDSRRKRRFCTARKQWEPLVRAPGGKKLLKLI